ncbi:hypothetical protein KIW84_076983 [Lathyrus oleraceus]|uniref:Retrotransposon gag domain-containing protein n=1 Tax=Pisum sativum TaxID=3888 RepID=A0A9D4W188_PEA|nr:hypothetical protein KIW84_076983 [Pisum sativum]
MSNNRNLSQALAAEMAMTEETTVVAEMKVAQKRRWPQKWRCSRRWRMGGNTDGKPYMCLPSAKDAWEVFKGTYFDIQNSSQIFGLKSKLWHAKQGERSVTSYYNELLTPWQELDLCYDDNLRCIEDNIMFLKR